MEFIIELFEMKSNSITRKLLVAARLDGENNRLIVGAQHAVPLRKHHAKR